MNRGTGEVDKREKELTRAKNAAYRFITYRPRSRSEVEVRLEDKEFSEEVILSAIDHCVRLGYIDDAKFAAQWAASRARCSGFGRRRIEQELRQKGVSRDTIREALAEAVTVEDELDVARKAAEKKLRSMKSVEPDARRRRLAAFLERKGFPMEIILSILKTMPLLSRQ